MNKKLLVVLMVMVLGVVAVFAPAIPNSASPNDSTGIVNPAKSAPVDGPVVDIKADTELIKLALVENDGINLSQVNVVVTKDTGKYAEGGITPKFELAGGGYFFGAKTAGGWKIVASGNGIITCESLKPYPDFPKDMIPECVDANWNPVQR